MANNLSASFPDVWAREQQETFLKENVAKNIADYNTTLDWVSYGDTLVKTYRSTNADDAPGVYTRGTDMVEKDITDTAETMTINRSFGELIYVDDFDKIQSRYDIAMAYGRDQGILLSNQVDAEVFAEALNADNVIDASSDWGTAGQWLTVTTSNVFKMFSTAKKKLQKQNVASTDFVGAVSPDVEDIINQYYAGRNTILGDDTNKNWFGGRVFGWRNLYTTNNLTATAVFSLTSNPSNGHTVTVAGQVFTFVSSIGTTAGNVLIWADADATRANLAALINAPSTTTANWVALWTASSAVVKRFVARISAVNDNAADTLTVTYKWGNVLDVAVSGTGTWTASLKKQHNLLTVKGNPVLVMQKTPVVQVVEHQSRLGKNIKNGVLFWVKSFRENKKQMVRVEVRTDTF